MAARVRQGAKLWLRMLAPMLVSVGLLVGLRLLGPEVVAQEELREWLEPLGKWGPVAYVGLLAVRPVLLLPGHLLTAVGGMVFGAWPATVYSMLGSALSAGVLFGLARWMGTGQMKRVLGGMYRAVSRTARRHGFRFALLTCLNPLLPTDIMLAAASASGARFWPLVAGMLLGTLPGTYLTAQFGSGLAQGRTWLTLVAAAGVGASVVLGALLGRRIWREFGESLATPGSGGSGRTQAGPEDSRARATSVSAVAPTRVSPPMGCPPMVPPRPT